MAKLSEERIRAEVEAKGFKLIDASLYQNMDSPIMVACSKGHIIETTLKSFKKQGFACPSCDTQLDFKVADTLPPKNGFRLIAFDNATEKMGVSVYDNGNLIFCKLFIFTGDMVGRLCKIRNLLEDIIIPQWQPDFMIYEDVQCQHGNFQVYKILSMLQGIIQVAAKRNGVEYEVIPATVWRRGLGIYGKNRQEEKNLSKRKVKEWFGIDAQEDVAEAILIGKYAVKKHKSAKAF